MNVHADILCVTVRRCVCAEFWDNDSVADEEGEVSVMVWNEAVKKYWVDIEVGHLLLLRNYRIRPQYDLFQLSATLFFPFPEL